MKKKVLTSVLTLLVFYLLLTGIGLLNSPEGQLKEAFNPIEQGGLWLFAFSWSLGTWGCVLLAIIVLLLLSAIYWLIRKILN